MRVCVYTCWVRGGFVVTIYIHICVYMYVNVHPFEVT